MDQNTVEIEAKFFIQDLDAFRAHLQTLPVELISERILERNWRFDTPERELTATGEVLRIRKDRCIRLTYKRPIIGTLQRREIELEVENFERMKLLLEALGYEEIYIYEKYRETFRLEDIEITLDEVPFGSFVEIEGPSIDSIRETAKKVNIAWNRSVPSTYLGIFQELKEKLNLPFRDATFHSFAEFNLDILEHLDFEDAFLIEPSLE